MGMFGTYDNLQDNYIPSNMKDCPTCNKENNTCQSCKPKKPYESYNELGELIGYWWHYGDTITLEFNIDGSVIVEDDAIIYRMSGQVPNIDTVGRGGQKAYNVVDYKSWTCLPNGDGTFNWLEDKEFMPPEKGDRNVYVDVNDFMKQKEVLIRFFNFRGEEIIEARKTFQGSSQIIYNIDEKLSKILKPSAYTCSVSVFNKELNHTLLGQEECKITVK